MPYKDIEKRKVYMKEYHIKNKEKISEYKKQWRENNREKTREYDRRYRENNPEKEKEHIRQYRKNNRKRYNEYSKQWIKNNPESRKKTKRNYNNNKYKTDLKFNLNCRMSRAMGNSLKGNKAGRKWEDLVGYTLKNLIRHLKKTMPEGYTWQDYMEGRLHIDHIIPESVFNYTKPEHIDFKRCWAFSNLRLLPARENISKSNKLKKPFQPTLAM